MCIDNYTSHLKSYLNPSSSGSCHEGSLLKRPNKVLVHNLMSRRIWKLAKQAKEKARTGRFKREMEIKNLRLYMANKIIVDENKKLKRKAKALLHENKILQSQLQKHLQASSE